MASKKSSLNQSPKQDLTKTTSFMNDQLFRQGPIVASGDMGEGFGNEKITASNQLRGLRRRGIKTTLNTLDSIKGNLFKTSLQDGDIWYDPRDRKLKAYAIGYKDFSWIGQFGDRPYYNDGDYVFHNGLLYKANGNADYTIIPGTILADGIRIPVIGYGTELPFDNSSAEYYLGFSAFSIPSGRNDLTGLQYQGVSYCNDEFGFGEDGEILTPEDGFYLLNSREHWLTRPGNINIASRLERDNGSGYSTISACYRYVPSLSGVVTSGSGAGGSVSITYGNIANDTTMNTWMGYLKKGDKIKVELYHDRTGNTIDLNADKIQITRLF